ncbi:solute carrier family 13 member 2-like isoform X2 [Eucyclogobius newberryi]|uniref:solute carrier family 13 member 2-like isoform X2 n=1 Tax=Eucyclogobius newberryi TaxID=166745 RepID=UPI003B59941F
MSFVQAQVCIQYLKDSNMLFIGGLVVAIAVEQWDLHKRIALQVLLIVGVKPSLLLVGFMSTTAFLSMWISNSAATAMMLPITKAVLDQLSDTEARADEKELETMAVSDTEETAVGEKEDEKTAKDTVLHVQENGFNNGGIKHQNSKDLQDAEEDDTHCCDKRALAEDRRVKREQKYTKLSKGMSLGICYSASIGGTATLTGTTPNMILKGQMDELFPENGGIINFASWFAFSFPNMILTLVLSWLWLQTLFVGFNLKESFGCCVKNQSQNKDYQVIRNEYKKLGRMSFAEACVLLIFMLLVLLWFTRDPGFIPGWATVLFNQEKKYVTDGTVAILMSSLFFCIPSSLPSSCCGSSNGASAEAPPPLLSWRVVHQKLPWNTLLLLGGGFALAHGSDKSGLSAWLGDTLIPLQNIPPFALSILLCLLVALFTECSSNTATTTLFLPILASMAVAIKIHPMYVMIPCAFASNLAFMLPVATPPNAIAFSFGNLKVIDMVRAGSMLNIIGIITINIAINTWGVAMFNLDTFPDWANVTLKP